MAIRFLAVQVTPSAVMPGGHGVDERLTVLDSTVEAALDVEGIDGVEGAVEAVTAIKTAVEAATPPGSLVISYDDEAITDGNTLQRAVAALVFNARNAGHIT